MASVQERDGKHQLRVKNKLLPKPYFHTFDTPDEAWAIGNRIEDLLKMGVIPIELMEGEKGNHQRLATVITNYLADQLANPSDADRELLPIVGAEVGVVKIPDITYAWVQNYVNDLKVKKNLAPSTVRKRVGALARVLDWHYLRVTGKVLSNAFRLLPKGYSAYTPQQAAAAKAGAKRDVQRKRRISKDELARVRLALSGVKREDRERPLKHAPEFELLFELIYGTGVRLFEGYRPRVGDFDFKRRWFKVSGSKGHRGAEKPRVVPLRSALADRLEKFCEGRGAEELLFSFWDGTTEGRKRTKSKLSVRFRVLFDYAKVPDFTEHDLRHSACCDWLEERNAQGYWAFSEVEIAKMMGWSNLDMLMVYASFRAEDLASRLAA